MKELISVIVPIYKVEKYLNKCIDSIINQTYNNLEIILVDDGSPDNCGKICDQYEKLDNRIKVIHKKNGGLSDARNEGVKNATGAYIAFIDSDDYVSNNYIEHLYTILKDYNADISIILPLKVDENFDGKFKENSIIIKEYNPKNGLLTMLYQKEFDNAAWGKLYKASIVNVTEFPVGKLYEDIGTTYKYLLNSNKIVYSNQHLYYYLQRNDSIMGKPFRIQEMDYSYQAKILLDDMKKKGDNDLIKAAECRYLNANFSVLLKIRRNKKFIDQRKEILSNIKKYRKDVLFNKNTRLKTKIAIILSYLGVM